MKANFAKKNLAKTSPELRFRQFSDAWIEKKLGELFIERNERSEDKDYDLLSVTLNDGIKSQKSANKRDGSSEDKSNYKIVHVNDIAYNTMRMWQGASGLSELEGIVSPAYTVVTLKDGSVSFFKHLFKRKRTVFNFYRYSQGMTSDTWNLKFQQFAEVSVTVPSSKEEQERVASFLDTIDLWLENLKKEKRLLQQYKEAILQKIFSQEIRFKDETGGQFPAWKKVIFSSLFEYVPTNSYSRDDLSYEGGNTHNIHYGDIHTTFRRSFDITRERVPFINKPNVLINPKNLCQEGDLIIADASEDYADIGKAIEIINLNGKNVVAGLHTIIARPKVPFEAGFLAYLMQSHSVRKQIRVFAQGAKVLGLSKRHLSKVQLHIPSLSEQRRIAEYLTSIETLMEKKRKEIEAMTYWKQGLLQKLFI